MNLSENFTLEEFTASQIAARRGIDNTPQSAEIRANLTRVAHVLERVRRLVNASVIITSGYRCPVLNAAVGSKDTSAHLVGLAADIQVPALGSARELCLAIRPHIIDFGIDQLIYEFQSWVHIGLSNTAPRNEVLTIDNSGARYGLA